MRVKETGRDLLDANQEPAEIPRRFRLSSDAPRALGCSTTFVRSNIAANISGVSLGAVFQQQGGDFIIEWLSKVLSGRAGRVTPCAPFSR
jgi:hypothetical protein